MTKIELLDLKSRAIIGNIRNMSSDCIERPRPRTQYMHFWRNTKKKLAEVLAEKGLLCTQRREVLEGLSEILKEYEKPQNTDSPEISKKCLEYLTEYGTNQEGN